MTNKEIIITEFSTDKEGVVLHTNIAASLKTGNVKGTSVWVSWDKIGKALFDDYTDKVEVDERDKLRNIKS